jgi:hypothetical protein
MNPLPYKHCLSGPATLALLAPMGLFALRIAAQPLSLMIDHPLLPHWDSWHSGVLGYPLLLTSQLLILAAMGWMNWRVVRGRCLQKPKLGRILAGIGGVYFVVMMVRGVVGLTWLPAHHWFGKPIPTFFHLVLAAWLLCLGKVYMRATSRSSQT